MFSQILKQGPTALCLNCDEQPLARNEFGGVWAVDTTGQLRLYTNIGDYAPSAAQGDTVLLWGTVTETANVTLSASVTIGSVTPGRQALANWDLAGFNVTFGADAVVHNLHIASAEGIKVNLAGITLRFQTCKLVLLDGNFDPDVTLNALYTFEMEECYVTGDPGVTEFRLGVTNQKTYIRLRDCEFVDISTRFGVGATGSMRVFGTQWINNTNSYFYNMAIGGTGPKFFESSRWYGANNSGVSAVGLVHVEAGLDNLRISNSNMRASKGANDGYGFVFQDVTITNVVIANFWGQDAGPITSMLYAPPAGITIRGPNSTFDGGAFVNVTVNP